ncbi:hypothetical protein EDD22DRAFT_842778 [Suillus occidentalis]|nr:hypothetical protein EDD22DRAFT_842778 [Suillus occidentalis]
MDYTTSYQPCASNESCLPLIATPLRDAGAASTTHADGIPLPSLAQPPPNSSGCVIIIQNNHIAEGGTINIFSSHCDGPHKVMTRSEHDSTATAEFMPSEPPSMKQAEPVKLGRENIVLSGNTFGECVMINIGSQNCTGAIKQTVLASRSDRNF